MKVFLSWSGDSSKKLALALYDWLPSVMQNVKPFMSAENIDKGERWSIDIAKELEETHFGIICVTAENLNAPWVLFEAGALSKSVQNSRVSPLMFGLDPSDFSKSPLLQFQLSMFKKDDFKKLLYSINNAAPETERIALEILNKAFERAWPELEADVSSIERMKTSSPKLPIPEPASVIQDKLGEALEEVLSNSRSQLRAINLVLEAISVEEKVRPPISPGHPVWRRIERNIASIQANLDAIQSTEYNISVPEVLPLINENLNELSRAIDFTRRYSTVSTMSKRNSSIPEA